jgi:hypothetical protein
VSVRIVIPSGGEHGGTGRFPEIAARVALVDMPSAKFARQQTDGVSTGAIFPARPRGRAGK